jgi:hypothetical protein
MDEGAAVATASPGRGRRVLGWLLTPGVVWAAAFVGGWLGALLGGSESSPGAGIRWMVAGGVLGGSVALVFWVWRLTRAGRSPAPDPPTD